MDAFDPVALPLVVTGLVEEGVEHGSVVLRADDGRVWQVGRAGAPHVGRRVRVTGRPLPGLLTTAQQGTPLEVLEVRTATDEVPQDPAGA